jgi:hypothetical protein
MHDWRHVYYFHFFETAYTGQMDFIVVGYLATGTGLLSNNSFFVSKVM